MKRLICRLRGHRWRLLDAIFRGGAEYRCARCGTKYTSFIGCPSWRPHHDAAFRASGRVEQPSQPAPAEKS